MSRLAEAQSSYLRSAAHQPIDWYEFGEEAFAKAKELDRPLLLDIGAVWCHWCHVIDRESYEDPEIAELINDNYIAVKVDRDQRPDIDARYQQAVMSLSGQGGWPLTGFLTYDGRLIHGGTYFPPHTMKALLTRIAEVYHAKKAEIFTDDQMLTDVMAAEHNQNRTQALQNALSNDAQEITPQVYQGILQSIRQSYDRYHHGFGQQPKFPHFSTLEFLITLEAQEPDTQNLEMIEKVLTAMAQGGIYDQIAGGFHRYSVDAEWHVPHFEKMAYDNAEALTVYAQAARQTKDERFKNLARETVLSTIAWVNRDLSDQTQGGFYASQDADINLEDDGDHFTWTIDEVKAILTSAEIELVLRYYDLTSGGDMHERPGRNVLWIKASLDANEQKLLTQVKEKMLAERLKRPIPFIDDTLYTNWNGMMICGYLEAAMLLDLSDAQAFALKSLDRILELFYQPNQAVLHTHGIPGVLEDYTWLAKANLKAYMVSGETRYLETAEDITNLVLTGFEDKEVGGFFDTKMDSNAVGLLKFRRKLLDDSPSSSANSIMLQVLNSLYTLTEKDIYNTSLKRALPSLTLETEGRGGFVAAFGLAIHQYLNPPLKLEIVGDSPELTEAAKKTFYPGKLLKYTSEASTPELRPCFGPRCLAPIRDLTALNTLLKESQLSRTH
ncbi:MAG: thioredoxin domain-containing protein [Vampirovibrio sp.]|nr:thioredoxin domain-containing protein [Vampirovibrio sp.]